jgi:hypothetical protein
MSYEPVIDRTTLLEGPAHIIYDKPGTKADWKYCWCAGDVTVHLVHTAKDVPVAGWGNIDDPRRDEVVEIDFTPAGNFGAALFNWMFSGVFSLLPGQSIFGATDSPVHVHTLDGKLMTVSNARVTTFPSVRFGAGLARFEGTAKITGVVKRNTARTAAGALFTAPAAETFLASPDPDDWVHLPCLATWGLAAPLTVATDENGWTLRAAHTLSPRVNPDLGTYDFRVDQSLVEASCRPVNITDADLLSAAVIGASRAIGAASPRGTLQLAEDYPGLTAKLYGARLASKPAVYGAGPRAGELTWRAYITPVEVGGVTSPRLADVAPTSEPEE